MSSAGTESPVDRGRQVMEENWPIQGPVSVVGRGMPVKLYRILKQAGSWPFFFFFFLIGCTAWLRDRTQSPFTGRQIPLTTGRNEALKDCQGSPFFVFEGFLAQNYNTLIYLVTYTFPCSIKKLSQLIKTHRIKDGRCDQDRQ